MPRLQPTTSTVIVRQGLAKPKVLNVQKAIFYVEIQKNDYHVMDTVVGTPKEIKEELETYNAFNAEIKLKKRYEDLEEIEINSYCRKCGLTLLKILK